MQRIEKFDVLMKKFEENQNKEDKSYTVLFLMKRQRAGKHKSANIMTEEK